MPGFSPLCSVDVILGYYHGIHILQPSITSTEHKGLNPGKTALIALIAHLVEHRFDSSFGRALHW